MGPPRRRDIYGQVRMRSFGSDKRLNVEAPRLIVNEVSLGDRLGFVAAEVRLTKALASYQALGLSPWVHSQHYQRRPTARRRSGGADAINTVANHLSFPFLASPSANTVSPTENLAMGFSGLSGCDLSVEAFNRFTSSGNTSQYRMHPQHP